MNVGPWRPAGSLAVDTFIFPATPPMAQGELWDTPALRRWRRRVVNPRDDARRLFETVERMIRPLVQVPAQSRRAESVPMVRKIAEVVAGAPFPPDDPHVPPAQWQDTIYPPPTGVQWDNTTRRLVQWYLCTEDEEVFSVSPSGALLLSALYGGARGQFGLCHSCGGFMAYPRKGKQRKYCDDCRAAKARMPSADRAVVLGADKRKRWRVIEARMRRRGFRRLEYTKMRQQQWRREAIAALRQTTNLDDWEREYAPKGKPGRPRGTTSQGQKEAER
jgi:hypothetical protein